MKELTKAELENRIKTEWAGKSLVFYESIGSTNIQAKELYREGAPHGTLLVAKKQTAAIGRRGRGWQSPKGAALSFSLLLRPDFAPDIASMLTLVMAQAVQEAIAEVCKLPVQIKWPNDIVLNGKKVTGILTEMGLCGSDIGYVVIGVGINAGKQEFSQELTEKATYLESLMEEPVDGALLLSRILEKFEAGYTIFSKEKNLNRFLEAYNAQLVNRDRQVRVLDPAGEYTGVARGINEKGELLVQTADGQVQEVYAGEVSVRGIYGYV